MQESESISVMNITSEASSQCKAQSATVNEKLSIGNHAQVKTLTLDLGTFTGWACMEGPSINTSGTLLLATEHELAHQRKDGNERTHDIRFSRFFKFIQMQLEYGVNRIVYEDVQFVRSQCQSQLWASLRTAIWAAVQDQQNIEIFCVSVPSLKMFATGMGNADKTAMARALGKIDPTHYQFNQATGELCSAGMVMDDNEVDAVWLALFTAAADRGEQHFFSLSQRKAMKKAEAKVKNQLSSDAIKALGKCCGVFRKRLSRLKAICPKCGVPVKIRISVSSTQVGTPPVTASTSPAA